MAQLATLDLTAYAAEHGLRVRNLHDGCSVPPAYRGTRLSAGHNHADDRDDAIICHYGYVTATGYSAGLLGWYLSVSTPAVFAATMAELRRVGAVVVQCGDDEAAGHARADLIGDLCRILRAVKEGKR